MTLEVLNVSFLQVTVATFSGRWPGAGALLKPSPCTNPSCCTGNSFVRPPKCCCGKPKQFLFLYKCHLAIQFPFLDELESTRLDHCVIQPQVNKPRVSMAKAAPNCS